MAEVTVVSEQVIFVDAEGDVTEDKRAAASGEVLQTLSDGTVRSTLFEIDGAAAAG